MKKYSKKDALDLTVKVDSEDEKYVNIMNELWQKLQKTHRLRLVKKRHHWRR